MQLFYNHEFITVYDVERHCVDWRTNKYKLEAGMYNSYTNFLLPYDDFNKKLDALVVKTLPDKSRLYFDGTSKYPRYKLQYSTFKRCLKVEKADCVIFNREKLSHLAYRNDNRYNGQPYAIVKDVDDKFYIVRISIIGTYTGKNQDVIDALVKDHVVGKKAQVIYTGTILRTEGSVEKDLVYNVLEGIYPKLLSDVDLDGMVNTNCEKLDEETVLSIQDMLRSVDSSVVEMGLKLLTNYDVNQYKYTIFVLLRLSMGNIKNCKAWNNTGIKQLRNTLEFVDCYTSDFPTCITYNMDSMKKYQATDEDKELCHKVIANATDDYIKKLNKKLEDKLASFNIKISAPKVQ